MERSEIIKEFIKNGFQLNPESLEYLVEKENVKFFLEELKKLTPPPITITLDILKDIEKKSIYSVEVLKLLKKKEGQISVSDFTGLFSSKYEKIRKILATHLDLINLISINKISEKTKKFSLIGMVREKNKEEKSLVVEDFTGEETIFFENLKEDFDVILEDEVLGFVCEKESEKVFVKRVVFPEIPLKKEINRTKEDVFCLFISDFHINSKDFNRRAYEKFLNWINNLDYKKLYVFIIGDVSSRESDIESLFNNLPKNYFYVLLKGEIDPETKRESLDSPCFIKIENSLVFLLLHQNFPPLTDFIPKTILNFLKKRQIPHQNKEIYIDSFIIDIIPDFIVSGHFHNPSILNYKGTTIITTGSFTTEPVFWLANLKTRETIKVDFT